MTLGVTHFYRAFSDGRCRQENLQPASGLLSSSFVSLPSELFKIFMCQCGHQPAADPYLASPLTTRPSFLNGVQAIHSSCTPYTREKFHSRIRPTARCRLPIILRNPIDIPRIIWEPFEQSVQQDPHIAASQCSCKLADRLEHRSPQDAEVEWWVSR